MGITYKQFPVFVLGPGQDANNSKILDLRLIFTRDDIINGSPVTLNPGETKLYAADTENNRLIFIGRHPTLTDRYYRKELPAANAYDYANYSVVNAGAYQSFYVVAGATHAKYMVKISVNSEVSISGEGGYILIDHRKSAWFTGSIVEPFNVVFYPDPPAAADSFFKISDRFEHSCTVEDSVHFTNTPRNGDQLIKTQYSFGITDSSIQLHQELPLAINNQVNTGGITSINGVTPVGGNINIQVLN